MNKPVTNLKPEAEVTADPLARLRDPFPPHQISKLPKPYKKDAPKAKCAECGGYHGLPAVHLDYVGHAALTDRLLDVDPHWTWEPVPEPASLGLPTAPGGMWIKLTVCGVSRYGFGHPDGKTGGDAVKETIGDALRNAAMRFGAALDLWHKGDLHAEEQEPDPAPSLEDRAIAHLRTCAAVGRDQFADAFNSNKDGWKKTLDAPAYARVVAEMKRLAGTFPKDEPKPPSPQAAAEDFGIGDDEIPF
jgi:hypothetical protein